MACALKDSKTKFPVSAQCSVHFEAKRTQQMLKALALAVTISATQVSVNFERKGLSVVAASPGIMVFADLSSQVTDFYGCYKRKVILCANTADLEKSVRSMDSDDICFQLFGSLLKISTATMAVELPVIE